MRVDERNGVRGYGYAMRVSCRAGYAPIRFSKNTLLAMDCGAIRA